MESDGSEVRMMEGFTRSLPSSPLLNLRLTKRTGRTVCCLHQCGETRFILFSDCVETIMISDKKNLTVFVFLFVYLLVFRPSQSSLLAELT